MVETAPGTLLQGTRQQVSRQVQAAAATLRAGLVGAQLERMFEEVPTLLMEPVESLQVRHRACENGVFAHVVSLVVVFQWLWTRTCILVMLATGGLEGAARPVGRRRGRPCRQRAQGAGFCGHLLVKTRTTAPRVSCTCDPRRRASDAC